MFKNGEGYPDPTFEAVYAKIRYEEKFKSKGKIKQNTERKKSKGKNINSGGDTKR